MKIQNAMDILERQISLFKPSTIDGKNYTMGTVPQTINLGYALGFDHQPELIQSLRKESDKDKRNVLKKGLWAITPSAVMEGGRRNGNIKQHSGLMAFDIDNIIEGKIPQYIETIKQIPYVAYLGLSASGKGLWGLMPIAYPEKHGLQFDAMHEAFKSLGIEIDTAPRAINSLRFISYDVSHYLNPIAQIFDLIKEPPKQTKTTLKIGRNKKDANNGKDEARDLISWFNANCSASDIDEVLTNFGFNFHSVRGSSYRYTRPDKDVKAGLSVDYHEDKRTLYSFSSEVPMLEKWKREASGWSCSPLTALLIYGCGGFNKEHYSTAFNYIKSKR